LQTETEFLKIVSLRFSQAFDRILHAVNQLDDEQLRYRPSNNSNSIGVIIQHVTGNLNQWIYSGVGGGTFQRHRAQEFKEAVSKSKEEILATTSSLRKKILDVVSQVPPDSLLSSRHIQGFDETVMSALIAALTHLELHSGQIIFLAKLILGEKYEESWQPENTEQGKE
jgi:uncharacterized damage-inducible protein DinB